MTNFVDDRTGFSSPEELAIYKSIGHYLRTKATITEHRRSGEGAFKTFCKEEKYIYDLMMRDLRNKRLGRRPVKGELGRHPKNLIGKTIGRLTVVKRAALPGKIRWFCRCSCGGFKVALSDHLLRSYQPVRSCGCLAKEHLAKINKMTKDYSKRNGCIKTLSAEEKTLYYSLNKHLLMKNPEYKKKILAYENKRMQLKWRRDPRLKLRHRNNEWKRKYGSFADAAKALNEIKKYCRQQNKQSTTGGD